MKTIREQLEAHGVVGSKEPPGQRLDKRPRKDSGAFATEFEKCICQLPWLGRVVSLQENRGFGFLQGYWHTEPIFFHIKGRQTVPDLAEKTLPLVGATVVFLFGSDPHSNSGGRAVRWMCARDLTWPKNTTPRDQTALNELRQKVLERLPMETLWSVLHANWYVRLWRDKAPTDLKDHVIRDVLLGRLAKMSVSELHDERVKAMLARSPYRFAGEFTSERDLAPSRLLDTFTSEQLTALIGLPNPGWMMRATMAHRSRLMEWYLAGTQSEDQESLWLPWFQGQEEFETGLAEKCLQAGGPHNDLARHWIKQLVQGGKLSSPQVRTWALQDSLSAAHLFEYLSEQDQSRCIGLWREDPTGLDTLLRKDLSRVASLFAHTALSVDLETDGHEIWEIGCARGTRQDLLYRKQPTADLAAAVATLSERIQGAPLLVGHNILAWDWPILARYLDTNCTPVIWDTMLVRYLMEPQAGSHALGGRHHADSDARDTASLFQRQLQSLPSLFIRSLLLGQFEDTQRLFRAIVEAIPADTMLTRSMPETMQSGADAGSMVTVLPEHRIRELDWVPGVVVVSANPEESLPNGLLQLDVGELERALGDTSVLSPAATALLAVARNARAQNVSLRRNMIPPWLLENESSLLAAVQGSCMVPDITDKQCVAPIPHKTSWWLELDPARYRLAVSTGRALVVAREPVAAESMLQEAREHEQASFLCLEQESNSKVWLGIDQPASVLSPRAGWRSFRTVEIQADQMPWAAASIPLPYKPVLAIRTGPVWHPNSRDQAEYWMEILRTLRELVDSLDGAVPILLVGSSQSQELVGLLRTALAEIELGEVKAEHHSRRSHLLRAARRSFALVDLVENWPAWHSIARDTGITLQPVIEALPIEEWYAASQTAAADLPNRPKTDAARAETERARAATRIDPAAILERLSRLVGDFMAGWLCEAGLAASERPVWIIDSRASIGGAGLGKCVELHTLYGEALLPEQTSCLREVFECFEIEREPAPSDYASMEQFLVQYWQRPDDGVASSIRGFKVSQKPAMQAICDRSNDVLIALPTGEGKSVLFQVPALCRGLRNRRLTLVLSPLKALMHDQVGRLRTSGFSESVDYIDGDRPHHEVIEVLQGILDHRVILLYVAPERLRNKSFVEVLRKRTTSDSGLEYVVVDEAHCINQWGYEFRPDYFYALELLLREFRIGADGDVTPFLLLSATITASDKERLKKLLCPREPSQVSLPFLCRPETFVQPLRSHIDVKTRYVHGRINDPNDFDKALEDRLPLIKQAVADAMANHTKTGQRSAVIIFVSRRDHAEVLAPRLDRATNARADFIHAGLDKETRTDISTQFKEGKIDVLVATKVFGMGMDIPDIHWAIHLAPPTYLEDYLQEVGRIGRDAVQREKAELDSLDAILLFSGDDFEGNRAQQLNGALQRLNVEDLDRSIRENTRKVEGQLMAILPEAGFNPPRKPSKRKAAINQVRMALHWVEKSGRVAICGRVPGLLSVTMNQGVLARIAKDGGEIGQVADLIRCIEVADTDSLESESHGSPASSRSSARSSARPQQSGNSAGTLLGRVLSRLGEAVGMMFGSLESAPDSSIKTRDTSQTVSLERDTPNIQTIVAAPDNEQGVINLRQVMMRMGFTQMGQVLACLVDISKRGGLVLEQKIQFSSRPMAKESADLVDALFAAVDGAAQQLLQRLSHSGHVEFVPDELIEDLVATLDDPTKQKKCRLAFVRGLQSMARASGVRLKQVLGDDESLCLDARLARSKIRNAQVRRKKILRQTRAVFNLLKQHMSDTGGQVPIAGLIDKLRAADRKRQFSQRDLGHAQRLLSAMSLFSFSSQLLPLCYVLLVADAPKPWDEEIELWQELDQANELKAVRSQALEIFANLPKDAQEQFIEGYFAQATATQLREFLDTQLGSVDIGSAESDPRISTFIVQKREHLRATKAKEFFDRYQGSEEPNQWKAICHPSDQHLLVNAGPGAGKTAVLVGRIAHLIHEQHILPSEIVVLAFNRAVVFEIKRRVKDLFQSLGYAAYVSRLRISTFHSLAVRHLARAGILDAARQEDSTNLLSAFSHKLGDDEEFRRAVAGSCRCILMDEFQDVTEDVYQIIRQLHLGSTSRPGVMVIGDDDQDILRWIRLDKRGPEFSETYFQRFRDDFGGNELPYLELGINFRSDKAIVELSQHMIETLLGRNTQTKRLKQSSLRVREAAAPGHVQRVSWDGITWEDALAYLVQKHAQHPHEGKLAILCRSNADVANAHRVLSECMGQVAIQGQADLRLGDLRHVSLWLDYLKAESSRRNRVLSASLKQQLLSSFATTVAIPEGPEFNALGVDLAELWDFCAQETSFPHISDLIDFITSLKTDELDRMRGSGRDQAPVVVSTIHKVKGLEFDEVVIPPSRKKFPFDKKVWEQNREQGRTTLERAAAEEARLLYVAMTRAKNRLLYFVGDREQAWGRHKSLRSYEGERDEGHLLKGSHKDVGLGWALQHSDYNPDPEECQRYIETEVRVGDTIVLGGRGGGAFKVLMHKANSGKLRQVGFLAKKHGSGSASADLKVSAVVRFRPSPNDDGHGTIADTVQNQSWGYAVLVSGRLR